MPLYEYKKNAENKLSLSEDVKSGIIFSTEKVLQSIIRESKPGLILLDGWYGVDFAKIITGLTSLNSNLVGTNVYSLFLSSDKIDEYRKPYMTDDPSFGWVNSNGTLDELLDENKAKSFLAGIDKTKVNVLYGPGAALDMFSKEASLIYYFDFTMQPLLWQMWDGKLVPFGKMQADPNYFWKNYYYNDFYLLLRQKKAVFEKMNYFVEAVNADKLKMMDRKTYNIIIDKLVEQPIKQVKITQPGPWGAYRYKDLWEIEGLECNAWNELAGIELSVLIDVAGEDLINVPAQNFMQRPVQMVGKYIHETYPDLMPLQVWLDDGYFPEPVSWERSSMPIHDHPSTSYVKRYFNEPLGRYETYYIVESYKGSSTWMGYKEDADVEEWERLCRESENQKEIPNWQDFVRRWDTNVGDLFLIPPGTSHGHGGNQMILEMDTGPSVAGTEYSFFTFDFARKTWDDNTKTMTAKPMRMHLEHSFDNNKFIRETRVKDTHRARPIAIDGNGKFRKDQYTTINEMPFHIERIFFEHTAVNDTEGKYMHIATLTEGKKVTVRSLSDPSKQTSIDRLQSCVIPAGFGKHEYINEDGSHAMVVLIRMKKG